MLRGGLRWEIPAVDADMKAGLLELLFDVDLAALDEGKQISAEPCDLGERETMFREVDGLSGEMGRGDIALGGCGVAVGALETELKLDGANGGVYLEGGVEVGVVRDGQGGEELCRPGPAVAAIARKALIDAERLARG